MPDDSQLLELIEQVKKHPSGSPKRQKAFHKLLLAVQKLPGIRKSSHPNYQSALCLTWEWFFKNIDEFEPQNDDVARSLEIWINGYLYWRIKDLYSPERQYESLDQPLGNEENRTLNETISNEDALIPSLDGLEGYIEQLQKEKTQRIGLAVEQYIEKDPDNKLKNCHPKENPHCNAQLLAKRILLKEPPDKLKAIATELDIKYQTLVSHWKRKVLKLLQEIAIEFGYKEETV